MTIIHNDFIYKDLPLIFIYSNNNISLNFYNDKFELIKIQSVNNNTLVDLKNLVSNTKSIVIGDTNYIKILKLI